MNRSHIDAPPPCAFMCGTQAFVVRNAPSRWIASTLFQPAKGNSSIGWTIWMPAFETRISTPPKRSTVAVTPVRFRVVMADPQIRIEQDLRRREKPGRKEAGDTRDRTRRNRPVLEQPPVEIILREEVEIETRGNHMPELPRVFDPAVVRAAGDDCGVDCPDGDACQPIGRDSVLVKRFVCSGLIGAERRRLEKQEYSVLDAW